MQFQLRSLRMKLQAVIFLTKVIVLFFHVVLLASQHFAKLNFFLVIRSVNRYIVQVKSVDSRGLLSLQFFHRHHFPCHVRRD